MARSPKVFTIPASAPFLPTLIGALLDGRLIERFSGRGDPLALAGATLYLPTRRACRAARDTFLTAANMDAAILPRIVSIGDVDADEIGFSDAAAGGLAPEALNLPEALGGLERRMVLAELILKWARQIRPDDPAQASLVAGNPASALMLAVDLARLMDDMTTRQVSWEKLNGLVPPEMDKHWEISFQFLKFVREHWPGILKDFHRSEPAERRDKLIAAERARLERVGGPVIAAGSTGSMPATAELIAAIARLPNGAVVLPGLDIDLDDKSWDRIGSGDSGHPQFALHGLLEKIGIRRDAVNALAPPADHGREPLVSEAMRPAPATDLWRDRLQRPQFAARAPLALRNVAVVEAANAEEEALAIAVALRHAIETTGRTAALVTPDRALARRVLAALARWNVPVDDSGGDALADTSPGVFARLIAEAALGGLEPVMLLAMLKHPLCRADKWAAGALEHAILRGPRPKTGTAGLRQALDRFREELGKLRRQEPSSLHRAEPRADMKDGEIDAASAVVAKLESALAPLEELGAEPVPFAEIALRHRRAFDALLDAGRVDPDSAEMRGLAAIFDTIEQGGRVALSPSEYADMFRAALADGNVVRPRQQDVRVRIYGPLEARLQHVDLMVLGGLTEGIWPPETRADPWLSRPMRHALGLDLPERRIGLSAHDFAQALGAPEIVLTRAARIAGAPTVASRFLQRLAAVAGEALWNEAIARGATYLQWARQLDRPHAPARPIARPRPRPPRDARPNRLNVTDIETLLRDPYSIYAKYVLGLRPLDAVDTPIGARDRGTVVHGAIGEFTARYADALPDDIERLLTGIGENHFAPLQDFPDAKAFWWPRFRRIARWFVQFETDRRPRIRKLHAEIAGQLEIPLSESVFTLRTRADRIEQLNDGTFAILDYKTGRAPSAKEVRVGLAPQLTLEAAILRAGGFGDFGRNASVSEISYIQIRGMEPPGEIQSIDKAPRWKGTTPNVQADYARRRLTEVLLKFDDPANEYLSRERPMFLRRYPGDYDHLARVREWSLTGGSEEEDGATE